MSRPPKIVTPKSVQFPDVMSLRLPNGLPVHIISTPGQDVVRVSLVWAAGSAVQQSAGVKPFVASSTLNLMAEGSEKYTSYELAEKLDFVGSYYDVSIDRDYAVMTFCSLGKFFAPTLEIFSQIVLHPTFPEHEVEIYARKRMERLAIERSKPATKARELFSAALFGGDHPYGMSSPESEYLNLTRADVTEFFDRFYGAGDCFAVCSMGDDPAQKEALLEMLGRMPVLPENSSREKTASGEKSLSDVPTHSDPRRVLTIDGAVQSAIRVGRLLFPRTHPDFVGMQVVATILGGYFGSRLIKNLREERGYTYGVMAAMVNLREAGYLAVATEVGADVTADAVEQIFAEMERMKAEPVSEDELDTVRRSMLGEVMRIMDGPFGVVDVVIENIQIFEGDSASNASGGSGTSARTSSTEKCAADPMYTNYVEDFIRQIESVTPARVRELARKYLDRDKFTVVIVGRE